MNGNSGMDTVWIFLMVLLVFASLAKMYAKDPREKKHEPEKIWYVASEK